ncbi:MAG: DEAD/DEAH box helicase [Deltaproteobacteria bacterium]|nr:DEAD/DEAH box helicase [Deltaproteobacteria bacterium]
MLTVRIDNQAHLGPLSELPGQVATQIRDRLTFQNPAHQEAEWRGYWTGNIPKEIVGYQVVGGELTVARGFTRQLIQILKTAGVQYHLDDQRRTLPEVDFTFNADLWDFQVEALEAIKARDSGTMGAPTGSGKTVVALALIAKRRQPALVVVHNKELQDQWVNRIETFLGIPAGEVGRIGGGKQIIGDKISVALVQSLYKCAGEIAPYVGFLIVDEAHRCPSRTFTEAVTAFDCRYMLGLSATPWRRDGLSRLIYWYLGDKVHEVDKEALVDGGHVLEAEVIWRETNFEPTYDASEEYSRMLSELTQDPERNSLIADDVAQEVGNGSGVCLVLSDRKAHCEALVDLLEARGIEAALLTGDLSPGQRQGVVTALNAGQIKVLVATGQLIGEGFDYRELRTLFLATPIKFNGRLIQYLGRVLRPAPGKAQAMVFDYHDVHVGVLMAAAQARARVYGPQGE